MIKHGMAGTLTYASWHAMTNRCFNKTHPKYHLYGGKGIVPCEFFRVSPLNMRLVLGERPGSEYSLERLDNSLGYNCGQCAECLSKEHALNVKWAGIVEQNRNRSCCKNVEWNGKIMNLPQWSIETGIPLGTLYRRYYSEDKLRGEALFTPARSGDGRSK